MKTELRWMALALMFTVLRVMFDSARAAGSDEKFSPGEKITQNISLRQLIADVLEKNPGLMAKRSEYEAAKSKVVGSFLPEDPMVGVDVEGQPELFHFGSRIDNETMIEQSFPFPTKLFLKGVIAAREADAAYERWKEEERSVVWHVEQPYFELYLSRKSLALLKDNETLLNQLLKSAKARYESGQASQQDLLKAEIELAKNSIEQFNLSRKAHLQEVHFSHLLDQPLETSYPLPDTDEQRAFPYRTEELERMTLEKRAELKVFRVGIDRAKAGRSLAKSEWMPDIKLRYEGRQFKGEDRIRENDAFIGFSVPFWSLAKGMNGAWKGADDEVRAAEQTYLMMKNEILLKVHEAYAKVEQAQNALTIYEQKILPQAKQQVDVSLASYEAGKTGFLDVVDAERTFKASELDYYAMLAQYRMGISDLRLAVGDDLVQAK